MDTPGGENVSGEGRGQASFFESHWWWCLGPPKTSRGWCEDTGKGLNNLFPDVQFEIVAGVRCVRKTEGTKQK